MNVNKKLYILMLSIHGLVKSEDIELGRDADTGGQIKYVIELIKTLSKRDKIRKIDLFTRKIIDKNVDDIYSKDIETINEKAKIVRIECGPKKYLRKEKLWDYLDEFSDKIVQYLRKIKDAPDVIHGHYADAGYVGSRVAAMLNIPFIFTGHSLGRVKKERLLLEKGVTEKQIENKYNISKRIEAEEIALSSAELIVASTRQEVNEQYKRYEMYSPRRMKVIPPGVDISNFRPPKRGDTTPQFVSNELSRFLKKLRKPYILAISRADERKNIKNLIKAYGESAKLQELANLVIIAGERDDYKKLEKGATKVIENMLYLIDKYDLYGKAAYPKKHSQNDIYEIYRHTAKLKGVFVNPALTEPFGLTLIEAAASGLPIVATNDGGPIDIEKNCKNVLLIDPTNIKEIEENILKILENKRLWARLSKNGLKGVHKHYTWESHVDKYIRHINSILRKKKYIHILETDNRKLQAVDRLIISDIDNTLLGDKESLVKLLDLINDKNYIGFGVASGRTIKSIINVLKKWKVMNPDIIISSVGTEIYYGKKLIRDRQWDKHISYRWYPTKIKEIMSTIKGIRMQPQSTQRTHKISYYMNPKIAPTKEELYKILRENGVYANVIYSHEKYIDILPIRASKGYAIRYISIKWDIPLDKILVAGDSGNDAEMLVGNTLAVVVGNYSPEIEHLKNEPQIYFAKEKYAAGIIEGIYYYNFLEKIKIEERW
ncbi:MAG: HAD-IIB family hydrolase [Deferribacterota bacterium]|nr:HAD-IIB family hydrolase [Deferribacterota bacterium]